MKTGYRSLEILKIVCSVDSTKCSDLLATLQKLNEPKVP